MAASTNLTSLLDFLPQSENQLETLQEIKTILFAVHPSALSDVVPNVSFAVIFSCLATEDREQISVCCDVLLRLLSAVDATVILHQFHDDLLNGLSHPETSVRLLALNQVVRAANASCQQVAQYPEVIVRIIAIISEDTLDTGKPASQVLVQLAESTEGLSALFSGEPYDEFGRVMELGDVIRMRLYEVLVTMSVVSEEALRHCSPFLARLCNELDTDDVLLQLNAMELVARLSGARHGYTYLEAQGTVARLERKLREMDTDPMAALLMPGLLKVFGHIGARHPEELCSSWEKVLHQVLDCTAAPDPALRGVAIETVGHIATTAEGKNALNKQGNRMTAACSNIGKTCIDAPTETRIKAIDAVVDLVTLQVADQSADMQSIVERWFSALCRDGVITVQTLAYQPFPEVHLGALRIFRALAGQPWGQRCLRHQAGCLDYLLDRSTEQEHEGKQAKYDVIAELVGSPTALDAMGAEAMMRIRAYHLEGPFFVQAESAVAYGGS